MKLLRFLVPLFIIACCVDSHAQLPGVPDVAQHEIARRGDHVEQTGTIRSGLMAAALSPPVDDSAKWFVTLVVRTNDRASVAMQQTIATDPAMRPWVNVAEPVKSTTHYQVRSIDDRTQADWLEPLRPAMARSGVPLIVLQPPKNGQFGQSSTVVKILSGVMSGEELSNKLREAVITYVNTLEPRGISQTTVIGAVSPPFLVPQQPVQPQQVPFEFPPAPVTPTPVPVVTPNPTTPMPLPPTTSLAPHWMTLIGTFVAGVVATYVTGTLRRKWTEFDALLKKADQITSAQLDQTE